MIYRILGKTGLKVSALGMGCSGIGKSLYSNDDDESLKTLYEAFEAGINFLIRHRITAMEIVKD